MKNPLLFIFLSSFLFFACREEKLTNNSLTEKIDQLANRYLALGRFSGTILVAKRNQLLFHQSYGLADYSTQEAFTENTAFKIGELTKFFTAYIIEQMARENKLKLTAQIKAYLPNFEGNHTVQDLLDKQHNPEKIGYHVLGKLIEKQLSISYQQAIEKYLSPLSIHQTFFQKETKVVAKGYLFHNYREQGLELEAAPNYEEAMVFSSKGLKSTAPDLWQLSVVLAHQPINKSGFLEEDGFSYTFQKDTTTNLTIIILSNRRHPVSEEMAQSIKAIYEEEFYELPLLRAPVVIDTKLYQNYLGIYQVNPNFKFEVIQQKDSLFTLMGEQKTHLIPQSATQFYYRDFDASIRFVQDSNTSISKAILYNGFLNGQIVHKKTER